MNSIYNLKRIVFIFVTAIAVISCARMSSPTGGPKDEDPPVALRSKPVNYSTNFKGEKIIIEFDEYVVLKNIGQELLVSPPLPEKPDVKLRGKSVIININNELKDSTTYNYNFYNAIADLNEGNVLKNFQFEFSTGDTFDSLYVGGTMRDAYDFSTEGNLYVMMYDRFNDTIPRTTLPNYIAKTDEKGHFFVTNLKKKPYYIFGLKDMNNNMLFDLPNESIAFIDSTFSPSFEEVTLTDTISIIKSISPDLKDTVRVDSIIYTKHMVTTIGNINLAMFTEEHYIQYYRAGYRPERQQVIFAFNSQLTDSFSVVPVIDSLNFDNWFLQEQFEDNDSIVLWIRDSTVYNKDSLLFSLSYVMKDSNNNDYVRHDTVLLTYEDKKQQIKKDNKKRRFNLDFLTEDEKNKEATDSVIVPSLLTFTHNAKSPFDLFSQVTLVARFPLETLDKSTIELYNVVDDTVDIPVKFTVSIDTLDYRKVIFDFKKDEEQTFKLLIPAGAITDIYDNINDTLSYTFKTRSFDYYSNVTMVLKGVEYKSIVQLIGNKNKVLEEIEINSDTTITFNDLLPLKYTFRLFYDKNGNGKWDTGNLKEMRQPEKVFYYPYIPKPLDVKSGMEIENTWDLQKK